MICCGQPMAGVRYAGTPEDYDGVSEWFCETCQRRVGRWTGRRLAEGELEPRAARLFGEELED